MNSFIRACFQNSLNSPDMETSLDYTPDEADSLIPHFGTLLGKAKLLHHEPHPPLQKTPVLKKLGCT